MASMLCLAVLLSLAAMSMAGQQTVTVKGAFFCGDQGGKNTWVKLLNKRTGFDDQIEKEVSADGSFEITLNVDRWFDLTPELHVYTDCNDSFLGVPKGCQRKWKLKIPEKYVNKGTYDVGRYNTETKQADEDRDCSTKRSWGVGK